MLQYVSCTQCRFHQSGRTPSLPSTWHIADGLLDRSRMRQYFTDRWRVATSDRVRWLFLSLAFIQLKFLTEGIISGTRYDALAKG